MKLPQFLIVGLLGTITNLVLFYIFVDILFYPPIIISVLTFLFASIQNYLLNHFWTFKKRKIPSSTFKRFYQFHIIAGIAGTINYLSFLAMFNIFFVYHFWTFKKKIDENPPQIANYFRFLSVSLIGLTINLLILWWYINTFDPSIKVVAQAIGIAGGTTINFLGSKYWVFK